MEKIMKKLSQFDIIVKNKEDLDEVLNTKYMNFKLKVNLDKFLNVPGVIQVTSDDCEKVQKDLGKLNDILLGLSGSSLPLRRGAVEDEEDLSLLLERGQLWVSQSIIKKVGQESHCHSNSAELYNLNHKDFPNLYLATGYALNIDGSWVQHTWLLLKKPKSTSIIETTSCKRLAYYGVIFNEDEAERFVYDN